LKGPDNVIMQAGRNYQARDQLDSYDYQLRLKRPGLKPNEDCADHEPGQHQQQSETHDSALKWCSLAFYVNCAYESGSRLG
jgi:hypothetical protein